MHEVINESQEIQKMFHNEGKQKVSFILTEMFAIITKKQKLISTFINPISVKMYDTSDKQNKKLARNCKICSEFI